MKLGRHLLAWVRRDHLDDELREELAQHRDWTAERLIAEGVPEQEARRRAAIQVGNVTGVREDVRGVWGFPAVDTILQDLRYGLRRLRGSPLFTVATIATLGLTIGATSALFAVANAVVWRPLSFPQSDRLASISVTSQGSDTAVMDEPTAYLAMASHVASFTSFALFNPMTAGLTGGTDPERVLGAQVSQDFFNVLRVQPALGRAFAPSEMQPGGPRAIVVSESLWVRALARDPNVLGRALTFDDHPYVVVGVMPAGFGFPRRSAFPGHTEFWLPMLPRVVKGGGVFYAGFLGRLRPGATVRNARDDLVQLRTSRARDVPAFARQNDIRVMLLHDRMYGDFRGPIVLLLGAVVSVLLIGCVNVANLLLARGTARRHELALRAALGASRGRVIRQLMIESVLLAGLGGLPALAVLYGALRAFLMLGPVTLTSIPGISVDGPVSGFLIGVTIAVGLLFGIAPALSGAARDPRERLEGGVRTLTGSNGHLRRILVAFEIAVAIVVVTGASLLVKSLIRFEAIDPGFHADGVLTASVNLPRSRYSDAGARRVFFGAALERVRALPGVQIAAFPGSWNSLSLTMAWGPSGKGRPESSQIGIWDGVGSSNFRTFGIPMLSGRECGDGEPAGARSAVINARMARLAFDRRPAVGQSLNLGDEGTFTVVGVAADVVRDIRTNAVPFPMVFTCVDPGNPPMSAEIAILAKSGTDPASLAPALRKTVAQIDPALPVADVATVRQLLDEAGAPRRFDALLFGTFGVLALTLAIFGLYAVTAYLVAQRTREFGLRIALGAGGTSVVRLVLRQALGPAVSGVGLGLVAATALAHLLQGMVFEVSTLDTAVFVEVPIVLVLVSGMAAAVPALRAVRVDPVVALRTD